MLGLPTHYVYLIKENGERENVMNTDCSTKAEVRQEVADLLKYYAKSEDISVYKKAQYTDSSNRVLYEFDLEDLDV